MVKLAIALIALVGCVDAVDERWELAHEHVVAVRATPPSVMPGEPVTFDALIAHADGPPTKGAVPIAMTEFVTDVPGPVTVGLAFDGANGEHLYATKVVNVGEHRANPELPPVMIDGQVATDRITMPLDEDVDLRIDVPAEDRVNWLSSCGSVFQDDVASAFIRVAHEDRREGQLAVVVRDPYGGVAWRVWPIVVTAAGTL